MSKFCRLCYRELPKDREGWEQHCFARKDWKEQQKGCEDKDDVFWKKLLITKEDLT